MVSIIVPVYNGQDHLEGCVNSILCQTCGELQLILVNDGSTDRTAALCDSFAVMDSRVTVIHQKNAGVSAARNAGLAAAKGEFVGFVDADDTITPDAYEVALKAIGGCDIAMWDTETVWPDGRKEPDTIPLLETDAVLEKKDWTPALLRQMAGSACRCLYRRELLEGVSFPVGIKLSEDRLFNLEAMGKAKKLAYLKRSLYLRTIREGSACNRYHGDRLEKSILAMECARGSLARYWTEDYLPVYTQAFIIDGALAAIREICSPAFPGKSRRKAIRAVAECEALKQAFDTCPPVGLREKLLKRKLSVFLLAVGMLERLKKWMGSI